MKINNVSMVRSAVRKLSGWSSIYHSMEHRVRPGKCLNRTNIINIIMLTQAKARTGSFSGFSGVENIRPKNPTGGKWSNTRPCTSALIKEGGPFMNQTPIMPVHIFNRSFCPAARESDSQGRSGGHDRSPCRGILRKFIHWTGRLWDFDQFMHEERARETGVQDDPPESGWVEKRRTISSASRFRP